MRIQAHHGIHCHRYMALSRCTQDPKAVGYCGPCTDRSSKVERGKTPLLAIPTMMPSCDPTGDPSIHPELPENYRSPCKDNRRVWPGCGSYRLYIIKTWNDVVS